MSFDQSLFNPSISINQTENSFRGTSNKATARMKSIEASIDSTQKQSQVHNLYAKLIQGDLETSKEKTKA